MLMWIVYKLKYSASFNELIFKWFHIDKCMLCNKNISVCLSICLDNFIKLFTLGTGHFGVDADTTVVINKYIVTLIILVA